ncbi:MAG: hypothetical protein LAO31_03955 [Acidobacteriia bacterium]|nr:hypothetical protein [Terriglobia bacterium]
MISKDNIKSVIIPPIQPGTASTGASRYWFIIPNSRYGSVAAITRLDAEKPQAETDPGMILLTAVLSQR